MNIEYTWNELANENVYFVFNGIRLLSASGPEKGFCSEVYYSQAFDDDGNPYDLQWESSDSSGDSEFFELVDCKLALLGGTE
jgi:hypothetical protein